ncbi:Hypothetical protein PFCIRM514_03140 [Propionibacterium freudenreichii]|nr:Hypothetical protein PFCIRM514_03140 [Propionibacterium freudenreichii]
MPERFMRKPTRHRVASHALASALATPAIRFSDATLDDRTIRLHDLPDGLKTELIESAERGQGGRGEGSVEHVEVFRMGSAGTSILVETSTPTRPPTRSGDYTLDREEPVYMVVRHARLSKGDLLGPDSQPANFAPNAPGV